MGNKWLPNQPTDFDLTWVTMAALRLFQEHIAGKNMLPDDIQQIATNGDLKRLPTLTELDRVVESLNCGLLEIAPVEAQPVTVGVGAIPTVEEQLAADLAALVRKQVKEMLRTAFKP